MEGKEKCEWAASIPMGLQDTHFFFFIAKHFSSKEYKTKKKKENSINT